MSIFAIGDLHLSNFPGSEKPMDVFGDRWFNHQERIKENWCRTVTEYDTVVVAGDISWGLKLQEAEYDLTRTLRELDLQYIDIFLLHEVAAGSLKEKMPAFEYLLEMQQKGVIRAVGLSTHCAPVIAAAADIPEIQIVCAPFNREGSRIEEGTLSDMEAALRKAHNNGKGVYVIKVLGKGELTYDIPGALRWAFERRAFIDVYNLGVANLSEARENLAALNALYDGEVRA